MKKTVFILNILALIAVSCGNRQTGKIPFDLTTLPSEWRDLTKVNDKLVACDDPFEVLRIEGNKLFRHYFARGEQSDTEYEILESYQIGDTVVINVKPTDGQEWTWDFKFCWLDKDKGVAEWIFNAESEAVTFVVNQNSLEDMIIKTIKAYQNQDETTLNKLILKDFGIAFVYSPGVMDDFSISDKISFSKPLPDYWSFDCDIITDYKIHFEALPVFDCDEEKWNKPPGIYCDTTNTDKTLSNIAKLRNEYSEGNWSATEIKKLEEIEKKSHKIIVTGKEGNEFIFILTFLQNRWHLSIIVRFEACSA
jgi:hypothetical protein